MKKYIALIISVIFILMTAIPASAAMLEVDTEEAATTFINFYEYQTGGKKVKENPDNTYAVSIYDVWPKNGKYYLLFEFVSEDAEEKEYYHTFGENNMYYEKSDVTNLLYPSGLVVCEAYHIYTGTYFDDCNYNYDNTYTPVNTESDVSEWTDDEFMSVEKACSLDSYLAEALVKKSENIGIVPVEERPTESSTETTPTESSSVTEPTTESEEVTDATEPSDTMPAPTEPTGTEPLDTEPAVTEPTSAKPTEPKKEVKPAAKKANKMKVTVKTKTVKAKKLKKGKVTVKAITVKNNNGAVTFKKVAKKSAKCLTINKKTGKITVKKGTKKGTYKINVKITAKGDKNYNSKTVTKTIKIKVK